MGSGATPLRGYPYPLETDIPDVAADLRALALALDTSAISTQGVLASRPASHAAGNKYMVQGDGTATNNGVEWWDTGSGWIAVNPVDAVAGVGSMRTLGTGAQQAAAGNDSRITGAEQTANKGVANGYASLDGSGLLTASQARVASVFGRTGAIVAGNADYLSVPSGGLTGATAATRFVGGTTSGAPSTGTFSAGDFVVDQSGKVWICTSGGTPGTWVNPTQPRRFAHTWSITGAIAVPSGSSDLTNFLCPMFVSIGSGETVKLVKVRYVIQTGTSVTFSINRNGSGATGLTGLSATTTATTTSPTAITLAEDDTIAPIVTAISGSPGNMSITCFFEHTP